MTAWHVPAGLRLERLSDQPGPAHAQARQFCLSTIKTFYGFDYRADWHDDLDSLLLPAGGNRYSRMHGGAFWVLRAADGGVVATAGVQHLGWKPALVPMVSTGTGEDIASLSRLYVRAADRGRGIGRWLVAACEAEAARLGYPTMYLHASSDAPGTLAFWHGTGYRVIGRCSTSTHFTRPIGQEQGMAAPAVSAGSGLAPPPPP